MANPNTIPWLHYQDIQISDVTLQQQFQQYCDDGQFVEALALLTNNEAQLQGKAFVANIINTITSAIVELEEYFNTGATVYLSNLVTQYSNLINNLTKKGTWLSTIQYTPYNFVIYNNEIYMCIKQPPVGTLPTNTTYWLYIGLRGVQGSPGVNVTMKYTWNSSNTYSPNDLVVYNGDIYVALSSNTNVIPTLNPAIWLLFLKINQGQIYVGTTAPTVPVNNMIWFQTETDPSQATTTTPIIGQFMRYIEAESIWDEMYPNVLFTWIVDEGNYMPSTFVDNVTIAQSAWSNNQWSYTYNNLTTNSMVYILPTTGMTATQMNIYNNLSISIMGTTITLTSGITPTADLSIIIQII